jgi:hypothetical protein
MLGVAEADLELEDAFVHMKGGRACGSRSPELVDLSPMFSGCSSCEPDVLDQSGDESRRSVKSTSHVDVTGRPGAGHVRHSAARDCRKSWREQKDRYLRQLLIRDITAVRLTDGSRL